MRKTFLAALITGLSLLTFVPVFSAGPSFRPDATFTGSSLTGWSTLGDAEWRAENGEIIGRPTGPGGGWLVLDRSYQDLGFYASFRCTTDCRTGVLVRAEKTDEGMKGLLLSLTAGDVAYYALTLDVQGRELRREPLRPGGGQVRIAPPPAPAPTSASGGAGRGSGRGGRGQGPGVTVPITPPDTSLRPGDWNQIEIRLDANVVRYFMNDGGQSPAIVEEAVGNYGPLALHVGGAGEVRFKDVAYKDLALRHRPAENVGSRFRMQRLSDFYYSWGAGAADFNRNGVMDVVSGPHIYFGPDYLTRREIYLALTFNPSNTYTTHAWMQFVGDFTGDGWPDVINPSFDGDPGVWMYINPGTESRRWDKHLVVERFNTEIAVMADLDGDGRLELVYGAEGRVRYAKPDPANPTGPWIVHNVSEAGLAPAHGIGTGDINGDGRVDIVNPYGWWEQPPPGSRGESWTYHPHAFSRYRGNNHGGSVMAVYDVNGNGLNDVVTVLNPHGWGMAWFEQKRDASGRISFERHMIMDDFWTKNAGGVAFSQPHGSTFGDVDGDGIPDFIVGKRYWAHQDTYMDPDPYGPAVLYWYRTVRNPKAPGGAEFVPELIHNRSGAGSHLLATDLNNDGRLDIVTPTRFGTFIFWGQK